MADLHYGQQRQMEDDSMAGTLRTQAEMIFPLERPILERLGLRATGRLADLGCGTGQFAGRAATAWPDLEIVGLDMFDRHVALAREAFPAEAHPHLSFVQGDARATDWADGSFGAVTIRHVLHALPDAEAIVAEAYRLLRPGGLFYVLDEDYDGLILDAPTEEARRLFVDAQPAMLAHGTDLHRGRTTFRSLRSAGFGQVRVDHVVVDTQSASRETFADMMRFWRDGYARFIGEAMGVEPDEIVARFDALIATILDPDRYSCWTIFAVSGRKPG
ncbi:MAG: methyltransferase domain-containing protein [Planctomycetota bacterium]|nr:methyltransferase domain-containing protein [Planctomycetota bacterium]